MILSAAGKPTKGSNVNKPTKESIVNKPTTAKPSKNINKIDIESKISAHALEDNSVVEKSSVGETAIVHCTFDNTPNQIGAFRQAKVR